MAKTNKKLTEKALKSVASRHNNTLEWGFNYERMQATGIAYAMLPALRELYDTEEEVCEHAIRHMQFYNCHPGASAVIAGVATALEEDYQTEMSDALKVALMGPMSGIGDTIQAVLVKPIFFIIAASMAAEGSFLSIPVIIFPFVALWALRWPLFNFGYKRSTSVIEDINGESALNKLKEAAQVIGLMVLGGFVPGMIKTKLALTYTKMIDGVEKVVTIQDTLDGILPYLFPILAVYFCYWLIKDKKVSPIKVIFILAVVGFVGGALGILA